MSFNPINRRKITATDLFIFGILFKGVLEQAFPKLILINSWLKEGEFFRYAYLFPAKDQVYLVHIENPNREVMS